MRALMSRWMRWLRQGRSVPQPASPIEHLAEELRVLLAERTELSRLVAGLREFDYQYVALDNERRIAELDREIRTVRAEIQMLKGAETAIRR